MAKVATNVILIWAGTHAGIPTGFTRETALDGRFPKATADAVDPNVTGGNATHTHSATANHSHTMDNHTHTYTLQDATGEPTINSSSTVVNSALQAHQHTGTTGNATGGGLSSVGATYSAYSNNPPFHEVIFIKSSGTHAVPDDVIALYDGIDDLPTDWVDCDGNNGTPNLHDKYLRGAGTGANAGTTGGSLNNTHDLVHTHTVNAHSHGDSTSTTYTGIHRSGSSPNVAGTHSHTVFVNSATDVISSTDPTLNPSETVEPAYKKLMAIQNQTGGNDLPIGITGLWLGDLADIPRGWILHDGLDGLTVDMRDKHLKIGASGEIGDTGGSNTHTHASQSHNHTASGTHTHTGSHSAHTNSTTRNGSSILNATSNSVHPIVFSNVTATYQSASTSADSANNEPLFTTVAFIKYVGVAPAGGAFLLTQI